MAWINLKSIARAMIWRMMRNGFHAKLEIMKSLRLASFLIAYALLLTACKTVEPEIEENRLKGFVLPKGPGVLWGRVLLSGAAPEEQIISFSKSRTAGGSEPLTTKRFVTDDDGGLANVFVLISQGLENRRFDSLLSPAVIECSGHEFSPLVTGVRKGQKVIWKTSDKVGFAVKSRPRAAGNRPFESVLMPNVTVETSYASPELFLRHESDLAPGVEAFVCVVDHPYFAVTDEHGMFALPPGLAPGKYTLTAQHAIAGKVSANLILGKNGNTRVAFEFGAPGSGIANRVRSIDAMGGGQPQVVRTTPRKVNPVGMIPGVPGPAVRQRAVPNALPPRRLAPPVRQSLQPARAHPQVVNRGPRRAGVPVSDSVLTRVFQVNAQRLLNGLRDSYMDPKGNASLQELFRQAIGKASGPETSGGPYPGVVLNAEAGVLQVKARRSEMEQIEALIKVLDQAPTQVAIDARILEVDVRDFDRFIDIHPLYSRMLNTENFTGILTEFEFREMLQRLSEMKGARLIHAPGVATLSGRTAEIRFDKETRLEIDPTVAPDKQSVEMEVLFATFADDADQPIQSLKTTARAMNRQTVMLGGMAREGKKTSGRFSSRDNTVMLLLITPNVVEEVGASRCGN